MLSQVIKNCLCEYVLRLFGLQKKEKSREKQAVGNGALKTVADGYT